MLGAATAVRVEAVVVPPNVEAASPATAPGSTERVRAAVVSLSLNVAELSNSSVPLGSFIGQYGDAPSATTRELYPLVVPTGGAVKRTFSLCTVLPSESVAVSR